MSTIPKNIQHWLEIDLDKLTANYQAVSSFIGEKVPIIAVVKNDAYGFGAVECAKAFAEAGAAMLAVTTLEEAIELREGGITAPVLVFLPPQKGEIEKYVEYDLTATVDGMRALNLLKHSGVKCHLKLNTGMNRFGANLDELAEILGGFWKKGAPQLTGAYSHMATALEQGDGFAKQQIALFKQMKERFTDFGFDGIMFHLANSAGALRFPEARFSAVRLGSVLYAQLGMAAKMGLDLADPFTAKAKVAAVRDLKKGDSVGYSREFVAAHDMRLAVIPYGYGDGFGVQASARELTIKDSVQNMSRDIGRLVLKRYKRGVYYQGQFLTALGRVAMQSMMVDISGLPDIKVGDVVEAPMRRTSASARLPRVYLCGGRIVATRVLIAENLSF